LFKTLISSQLFRVMFKIKHRPMHDKSNYCLISDNDNIIINMFTVNEKCPVPKYHACRCSQRLHSVEGSDLASLWAGLTLSLSFTHVTKIRLKFGTCGEVYFTLLMLLAVLVRCSVPLML
jgi:hypothetical protein